MDAAMLIEMAYDPDRMPEPIVTVPTVPTDDEIYSVCAKATGGNRLPVKVMDDAFKAELCGEPILDDLGYPATTATLFQKTTTVEDDDESIELSPALMAEIEKISGYHAQAAGRLVASSLGKVVAHPLVKRAASTNLDSHPEQGRKILSTEKVGRLRTTKYTGGIEVLEICEDDE